LLPEHAERASQSVSTSWPSASHLPRPPHACSSCMFLMPAATCSHHPPTCTAAPEEMPTSRPSSLANRLAISTASSLGICSESGKGSVRWSQAQADGGQAVCKGCVHCPSLSAGRQRAGQRKLQERALNYRSNHHLASSTWHLMSRSAPAALHHTWVLSPPTVQRLSE